MDAHPVPQNVTNFEFHLVGDMTLKQFAYLGLGIGLAYLSYVLFGNNPDAVLRILAWVLAAIFALIGVAFAFLPVQERPLDVWIGAYFSAIFKPTQYKYQPSAIPLEDPRFKKRVDVYFASLGMIPFEADFAPPPPPPAPAEPAAEANTQKAENTVPPTTAAPIPAPAAPEPKPAAAPSTPAPQAAPPSFLKPLNPQLPKQEKAVIPSSEELKQTVALAKNAQQIQGEIKQTEEKLVKIKNEAAQPGADAKVFSQKFQAILTDLQKLNQEAAMISQKMASLSNTAAPQQQAEAHVVKPRVAPTISLTSTPNIINGIVTDFTGNYLEGAIIVAHDKQNLPVRALKSNKLGQFIAATPLPDGVYTLIVEKESMTFDVVEVELKGEVPKPVMIAAKG